MIKVIDETRGAIVEECHDFIIKLYGCKMFCNDKEIEQIKNVQNNIVNLIEILKGNLCQELN